MATQTKKKTTEKTEETPNVARRVVGRWAQAQRTALDWQKSAMDAGFDAMARMEERQNEMVNGWLDRSERVPAEMKEVVGEWSELRKSGRENFRQAVDRTFTLFGQYYEGLETGNKASA